MSTLRSAAALALSLLLAAVVAPPLASAGASDAQAGDADLDALVRGNTDFALALYRALIADHDGNVVIAPHGVSAALAMTYAGARGATAREMAAALRFELPSATLHPAFARLARELRLAPEESATSEIGEANRLWGQEGQAFLDEFLRTARDDYGGGFETVDFGGAAGEARRVINRWIEEQTGGRIGDALTSADLSPSTMVVLTNAIHFKGTWNTRFDEAQTGDGPFHLQGADPVTVPLMSLTAKLPCLEADDLHVLELPYAGKRLSMVLLVPRARDGLATIEETLSGEVLETLLGRLSPRPVRVVLPRFKLETRFRLEDALARTGMPSAFAPGRADLSGICCRPGQIWIDLVVHQAFVEVNEEGTEAAAGTAVVVNRGAAEEPPVIRADHPFLFLVRDRHTGALLFLGRVSDPSP